MFCPDCGKESPEGTKFCPECGKDLASYFNQNVYVDEEAGTPVNDIPENQNKNNKNDYSDFYANNNNNQPVKKSSKGVVVFLVIVIIILILAIAAGYLYATGKLDKYLPESMASSEVITDNPLADTTIENATTEIATETVAPETTVAEVATEAPTVAPTEAPTEVQTVDVKTIYSSILSTYTSSELGYTAYYSTFDINADGTKELMIQYGTCEADSMIDFYSIKDGSAFMCGQLGGTHSVLTVDGNNLYLLEGSQGYESMWQITFDGTNINETTLIDGVYYEGDYEMYGDYIDTYDYTDMSGLDD